MSLTDLASIGNFVSGIAVVISFFFLGFQMRQNTKAVKAAASQAHAANFQQVIAPAIVDASMARIWRLGLADIQNLSDDERVRFYVLLSSLFRFYEAARLQWLDGQLHKEHWENVEFQVADFAQQPGVQAYWSMRRNWHSKSFRIWFESSPRAKAPDHGLYDKPEDVTK